MSTKETHIDPDRYKEATAHYLAGLAEDSPLSFDVIDSDGNIVFKTGQRIRPDVIEGLSKRGKRFYVPRMGRDGDFSRQIFSQEMMHNLIEDTSALFSDIRRLGTMTHEQYINACNQYGFLLQRLLPQDKTGGVLTLLHRARSGSHSAMHSVNVGLLAMIYSYKNGDPQEKIMNMAISGFLHDVGKQKVDENIILKPGALTREEFSAMMDHTKEGYRILDAVKNDKGDKVIPNVVKIVSLFHHRRLKSQGYPFKEGATRDDSERSYLELPAEARIIGIMDLYDAVTTNTPYRKSTGIESALRYILNLSGYLYTVEDVHSFLRVMGLTLNHGKSFLNPGDFVVLESVKVHPETRKKSRTYEFAKVEELYRSGLLTPKVTIFFNASKNTRINPISIDLHYDTSRKVVRVIHSPRLMGMMQRYMK
ncbi:MAG: HD domain-containing protein [Spirochaetes bacterium]|nr:HD domain-containing protein [Spirochaetota bacterium]